nr:MAG TPA: putative RNA polymerase/capsid protein [Caudoviricetes sp.]DAV73892.1 MAG TPA: putative RNA polymerase/capsid protein [Bacteriophage sp.]
MADANKEWIVNPIKQANEYAKMDKQFAQQAAMQARGFQHDKEMEGIRNRN